MEPTSQKEHDRKHSASIANESHKIVNLPLGDLIRIVHGHLHVYYGLTFLGHVGLCQVSLKLEELKYLLAFKQLQALCCVAELSTTEGQLVRLGVIHINQIAYFAVYRTLEGLSNVVEVDEVFLKNQTKVHLVEVVFELGVTHALLVNRQVFGLAAIQVEL